MRPCISKKILGGIKKYQNTKTSVIKKVIFYQKLNDDIKKYQNTETPKHLQVTHKTTKPHHHTTKQRTHVSTSVDMGKNMKLWQDHTNLHELELNRNARYFQSQLKFMQNS